MSIHRYVVEKLRTHGVEKSERGKLILEDLKLLSMFVALERAVIDRSFDAVLAAAGDIEEYLESIGKRSLLVLVYMYLRFSNLTPKITKPDNKLSDGLVQKSYVFTHQITDEERLIGLWAAVKYDEVGEALLKTVYSAG